MKTLALLRHAKSDWSDRDLDDFDRPLAPRGLKAARRMGKAMRKLGLVPDLVLCSRARRTCQTWDLAAPELACDAPVSARRDLYLASPDSLLHAIRGVEPDTGTLLLIGHNPGIHGLAAALSGPDSDPMAARTMLESFPTAALAVLTFEARSWRDAGPGAGRLIQFLRPRALE